MYGACGVGAFGKVPGGPTAGIPSPMVRRPTGYRSVHQPVACRSALAASLVVLLHRLNRVCLLPAVALCAGHARHRLPSDCHALAGFEIGQRPRLIRRLPYAMPDTRQSFFSLADQAAHFFAVGRALRTMVSAPCTMAWSAVGAATAPILNVADSKLGADCLRWRRFAEWLAA